MNKIHLYLALIISLVVTQPVKAFKTKNLPKGFKEQKATGISFAENKGQVCDQYYNARPDVLYSGSANGMVYHLRNNGISYQLNRVDLWKEEEDLKNVEKRKVVDQRTIYRLDINWLGINNNFKIQTEKPLDGLSNYYLEVCPDGVRNVRGYEGVFYNNIYSNINLHYYQKNGTLKYDYIVAPGADYKQIQLQVEGAENIILQKDGSLLFKTPLGTIKEGAPIVFQDGKQLRAKWVVTNDVLSFSISNYNPSLELIIDPAVRLWGTYYGDAGYDAGQSCTTDTLNNVYVAGRADSYAGTLIATTGSHQSVAGGGADAFLSKFNSAGVRQWATYYGASGADIALSCTIDLTGNIYLVGYTSSNTGNVIATPGSHQLAYVGSNDAFLVKFDNAGIRQWGTYYGGGGQDYGYCCATDASGNVYMTGYTLSGTGTVIATAGSYQSAFGGSSDAFLVKFNSSGVRQWGTYYGGPGGDVGFYCAIDALGNVYLTGSTDATGGIATASGYQNTYGGGTRDGFLVKFSGAGIRLWGTYYGGAGYDEGYYCVTDASSNVYMAGWTTTNTGLEIATATSHQPAFGGNADAYLVKFSSSGIRQWGSYYGGTGDDRGYSCSIDAVGNLYLAGFTSFSTGTTIATTGSHQFVNGGAVDAFIAKFNNVGVRQWGTYYGGAGNEQGYSCKADKAGNVYLTGYTNSGTSTVIATSGAHQSSIGGGFDGYLVKLKTCISLNATPAVNAVMCAGASINFTATITGTTTPSYNWDGPDSFSSTLQNPVIASAGTVNVGVYTLTVNNNGCVETATTQVSAVNPIPIVSANSGNICSGNSFTIVPDGASTYTYSGGSAVVSPTVNATYSVTGTSAQGCVSSNTAVLTVIVNELPIITVNSGVICAGQSFTITPSGATTYTYSDGSAVITPTVNTTYSISGTDANGCVNTAASTVTVNIAPAIMAATSNSVICTGEMTVLTASTSATSYTWSTGVTTLSVSVSPTITSTYTINVTDINGCVGMANVTVIVDVCTEINETVSKTISVYPNPSTCMLNISITASLANNSKIEIYDALGKLVVTLVLVSESNTLNISHLNNGMYTFKILNNSNIIKTAKLIKQ